MSFINNLAKGFVRSAVNQVGRDGGRVISNKVYGSSHASPISVQSGESISTDNLVKEDIFTKISWAVLLSLFVPMIGGVIVVIKAIINYNKKYQTMYSVEYKPVYKSDRRYTTGVKQIGYTEKKTPVKVDRTPEGDKRNRTKSVWYFVIGFLSLLVYSYLFFYRS